jgi:hypothetical protein
VGKCASSVVRAVSLLRRAGVLCLLISPLFLMGPLVFSAQSWFDRGDRALTRLARRVSHLLSEAWWDYFNWAVTASGPCFIKLMQARAAPPAPRESRPRACVAGPPRSC